MAAPTPLALIVSVRLGLAANGRPYGVHVIRRYLYAKFSQRELSLQLLSFQFFPLVEQLFPLLKQLFPLVLLGLFFPVLLGLFELTAFLPLLLQPFQLLGLLFPLLPALRGIGGRLRGKAAAERRDPRGRLWLRRPLGPFRRGQGRGKGPVAAQRDQPELHPCLSLQVRPQRLHAGLGH